MWGVPVDHDYFESINDVQWLWYYYNYIKDQDDDLLLKRELLEYHAGFSAPEVVDKLRKRRAEEEERENTPSNDEDNPGFAAGLERLFGRTIDGSKFEEDVLSRFDTVVDKLSEEDYNNITKDEPVYNYKYWLNFDLG